MSRRKRPRTWVIVPTEDGTFELLRNGRPLASGLDEHSLYRRLTRDIGSQDLLRREHDDGHQEAVRLSDFVRERKKV